MNEVCCLVVEGNVGWITFTYIVYVKLMSLMKFDLAFGLECIIKS